MSQTGPESPDLHPVCCQSTATLPPMTRPRLHAHCIVHPIAVPVLPRARAPPTRTSSWLRNTSCRVPSFLCRPINGNPSFISSESPRKSPPAAPVGSSARPPHGPLPPSCPIWSLAGPLPKSLRDRFSRSILALTVSTPPSGPSMSTFWGHTRYRWPAIPRYHPLQPLQGPWSFISRLSRPAKTLVARKKKSEKKNYCRARCW